MLFNLVTLLGTKRNRSTKPVHTRDLKLKTKGLKTLEVDQIDAAYAALLNKNVDAILFDAPVLLYYAAHEGQGKVSLVGETLRDENYGILLPMNSPNRKPINEALLSIKENGTYQSLYNKWFKTSLDNQE
jgi:polar amino acid transport system substrate-binding protein